MNEEVSAKVVVHFQPESYRKRAVPIFERTSLKRPGFDWFDRVPGGPPNRRTRLTSAAELAEVPLLRGG